MRVKNFSFFAREHTKMRAAEEENARQDTKMCAGRVEYARPHTKMRAEQIKWENARNQPTNEWNTQPSHNARMKNIGLSSWTTKINFKSLKYELQELRTRTQSFQNCFYIVSWGWYTPERGNKR